MHTHTCVRAHTRTCNHLHHHLHHHFPARLSPRSCIFRHYARHYDFSGFKNLANSEKFIVVYPLGTGIPIGFNAGSCCGMPQLFGTDDTGFVMSVINRVKGSHTVDPNRVYLTGYVSFGRTVSPSLYGPTTFRTSDLPRIRFASPSLSHKVDPTRVYPTGYATLGRTIASLLHPHFLSCKVISRGSFTSWVFPWPRKVP